jgi:hypothetical protein
MLFKNIYACLLVSAAFSTSAFGADTATCKITRAENAPFSHFVGGTISIDLKTGNNRLYAIDESGNTLQYSPINDNLVSSFGVDRKTCKTSVNKENNQNGQLKSVRFVFENCEDRDPSIPNYTAYVSVTQSFNLETNRGIYQELFLDGGQTKSQYFFFGDCSIF